MAENMDTQLKQMSEDLKEIIEHLNETNRTQDTSDPVSMLFEKYLICILKLTFFTLSAFERCFTADRGIFAPLPHCRIMCVCK